MTRDQLRQSMLRRNARAMAHLQALLADPRALAHLQSQDPQTDHRAISSLMVAWLDQQRRELLDGVFPLSLPPPRLREFLEAQA